MRIVTPPHRTPKKVRVGPSKRHGTGLFAETPIRKGQYVITYEGHKTRGFKSIYILHYPLDNQRWLKIMGTGPAKYINHSGKPNLELGDEDDCFNFFALRNIRAGEELLWHYGDEFADWLALKN